MARQFPAYVVPSLYILASRYLFELPKVVGQIRHLALLEDRIFAIRATETTTGEAGSQVVAVERDSVIRNGSVTWTYLFNSAVVDGSRSTKVPAGKWGEIDGDGLAGARVVSRERGVAELACGVLPCLVDVGALQFFLALVVFFSASARISFSCKGQTCEASHSHFLFPVAYYTEALPNAHPFAFL